MLLPQTRSWVYEIRCLSPAYRPRMCKAVKMSSIQPRGTEPIFFSFLVCQTRHKPGMFHSPCSFGVRMTKKYLFHSPRKCQSPSITHQARHCTFVPSLIEISLKILSRVANMAQDIDCLGSGCEWLFMKSIDSAVQLS